MKTIFIPAAAILLLSSCAQFSTPAGSKINVSSSSDGGYYSNGSYHSSRTYYIEKAGEDRVKLKPKNLIRFVNDNPDALRAARSYKIFHTVCIASFVGAFGAITYGILGRENNEQTAQTFLKAGLLAFPVAIISAPIASHGAKKAIKTYNGF